MDGNGTCHVFLEGKTYEVNQVWALCFIRDGYALQKVKLEVSNAQT